MYRVYAMYNRNYWAISVLVAIALAQVGFGIHLFTGPGSGRKLPLCTSTYNLLMTNLD